MTAAKNPWENEGRSDLSPAPPRLRRVLSLPDLIIYGIVSVTPSAPVTVFGLAVVMSCGHAVDTILIAMVAMLLTAFSYGRMASIYPSAGSAYAYVGRGLNPHLGFLAGWAMLLDYLAIPIFCTIYAALTLQRLVPGVPYAVWVTFIVGAITVLNLRGIRVTARINQILLIIMGSVLVAFIILAARYLVRQHGWNGLFSSVPFYNPQTFDFNSIRTATAFAALTYGGFDAVTTLAEDAKNPRRNVLLATVLVCLFTGLFGGLLVYLGQLVWPDYHTFPNIETAFYDASRRVGGAWLFEGMAAILVVAMFGSGFTGQVGAARLLFAMGRDGVLPSRIFAYLNPKRSNPTFNITIVGVIAFAGALLMSYELSAEVLNFGMFFAFMGVNLAAMRQFYFLRRDKGLLKDAVMPGLGFLFCLGIWWSLSAPAKIAGGLWFLAGLAYNLVQTRGWRIPPPMIDSVDL
ncbi:MAG: APC family permease [Terracidiphilus sp.]